MGKMIPLKEYAEKIGKDPTHLTKKARKGILTTAVKMGRDWLIDEDEPFIDYRTLDGKKRKKTMEEAGL